MLNKTVGEVVNEVLMLNAVKAGFAFLIVEGNDDLRFWESRTGESCEVVNATGKTTGKGAVRRLNTRGFNGHLGVFDRDYDDLHTVSNWQINEIYWDAHSLETLLYYSNAFDKLVSEHVGQAKRLAVEVSLGESLRNFVERVSRVIGELRYIHRLSGSGADSESLSPFRHVDDVSLQFNINSLYVEGVAIGAAPSVAQLRIAVTEYAQLEPRFLMRGHDVSAVISIAIRFCGGSCGNKRVEEVLRVGYERAALEGTSVFAEILEWEAARPPKRILS